MCCAYQQSHGAADCAGSFSFLAAPTYNSFSGLLIVSHFTGAKRESFHFEILFALLSN
jgi:hypothetical protein